jgi:hypothetical protein
VRANATDNEALTDGILARPLDSARGRPESACGCLADNDDEWRAVDIARREVASRYQWNPHRSEVARLDDVAVREALGRGLPRHGRRTGKCHTETQRLGREWQRLRHRRTLDARQRAYSIEQVAHEPQAAGRCPIRR